MGRPPLPGWPAWPPGPWSSRAPSDYLSWSSGLAYRRALPNAELVYLRQAGHNAYQDQPAAYQGPP